MDQPALFDHYVRLLKEFVALRSISTDPKYARDIEKTAAWLGNLLSKNGFAVDITASGGGNPIVCARYKNKNPRHVLIYGHYDVQPAAKEEGWSSDPFELTERDGRLLGRGAVDNKGQIMIYIATVIDLIKKNELCYDVTFLIEGNEEAGSSGLDAFIETNKDKLSADFLLVSDGEITAGHPVIEVGFRGVLNIALTVKTSTKDNHSGLYGGIIPNAATELTILLGKIFDQSTGEQKVTVKGFYDNVTPPTSKDIATTEKIPFVADDLHDLSGTKTYFAREGWNIHAQLGFAPSLEITGIQSGYTGVGFRNSIPGKAVAKMNVRLVNNQKPKDIVKKFEMFVAENLPDYCSFTIEGDESCPAVHIPTDGPVFEKATKLMEEVYGDSVLHKYCGATIPLAALFEESLKIPQLYIPMANEDCNMHGADENFSIELAQKGLRFAQAFLRRP